MTAPIAPCLWFDGQAQAALDFYSSVFPDAEDLGGSPTVVGMKLADLRFILLNGGPEYKINPAISFFYHCDTEKEIDALWKSLSEGGSALMPLAAYPFARKYGWIADRFGVNWQLMLPSGKAPRKVFPSLMFTGDRSGRAEEAIERYTDIFKPSSLGTVSRYGAGQAPDVEGTLNYCEFSLGGQWFSAMDSAQPHRFSFNEAVSLSVSCETQEEIDYFWARLAEGGSEGRCGWLKDEFGVSWQVVPRVLEGLMADQARAGRVVAAFMKMSKFDIKTLLEA